MIAKNMLEEVLAKALSFGGDFAEIFIEDKVTNSIRMVDDKIDDAVSGRDHGAGIRIMKGFRSVYAYTNDTSITALIDTAYKAACALKDDKQNLDITLTERMPSNIHPILYMPSSVDNLKKAVIVKTAYKAAKDYSPEIIQVTVGYGDVDQKVLIANSEGLLVEDRRVRTRLVIQSIASNGSESRLVLKGLAGIWDLKCLKQLTLNTMQRKLAVWL